jgi:anthranilate phosphoribosyltransferase
MAMSADFADILELLARREHLTDTEADFVFAAVLDGSISNEQIGALLMGLRSKGETVLEICAAVKATRARMIKASVRADAIDLCGTGGDGQHTLNISTATALVVAACGVPVAKHGNKAASSQSGATDVLSVLGVNTDAPQAVVERCVNELGIGYFAAPLYHPALKNLVPVRRALGFRTLFNLLGPLCNPAGVTRQMIGVPAVGVINAFLDVLRQIGSESATIVCGAGPIDEFSLAGLNHYRSFYQLQAGDMRTITSADMHLMSAPLDEIRGGSPDENARALLKLLSGQTGAYRDTVLMNAAFALEMADPAGGSPLDRVAAAADAIDSGKARTLLQDWISMSNKS